MAYTVEDFQRDVALEALPYLTPEERVKDLKPEERVKGLKPEERMKDLKPEERVKGLKPGDVDRLLQGMDPALRAILKQRLTEEN